MPYQRRPSIRVIQNSSIPIPRVLGAGIIALAVNVLLLGLASHFGIDTAGGAFQRLIKLWTTPLKNEGSGKARNEGYQRKFNGRQFDISLEIRYPIWLDRNISRHSSC